MYLVLMVRFWFWGLANTGIPDEAGKYTGQRASSRSKINNDES